MRAELATQVSARVTDGDGLRVGVEYIPAEQAPETAGLWMPQIAVQRLEDALRPQFPGVNLSWLLSAHFLPTRYSAEEIRVFEAKLEVVKRHQALSLDAFKAVELKLLTQQQVPTSPAEPSTPQEPSQA